MRHRFLAGPVLSATVVALALFASSIASAADGTWIRHDPGPRLSHSFAADPAGHRVILFGGYDGTGFLKPSAYLDDTWQLDMSGDPKWTQLTTGGGPLKRMLGMMVLDPTRNRMVMFGGKTSTTYYNDTWTFDLGTNSWSPLAPAASPPPSETPGVYDPIRDRVVTFGGYRPGSGDVNEVWQLTFSGTPTWSLLPTVGTPPSPRRALTTIYDPLGDRLIAFGGYSDAGGIHHNQVWALTLFGTPTWSLLTPTGTPPSGRQGHHSVYDPLRMRMIMIGGFDSNFLNDAWALDLSGSGSWTPLVLNGPMPLERDFAGMEYDIDNDRLVLVGGNTRIAGVSTAQALGDVWTVDIENLPTATTVSAAEPVVAPDRVRLRWQVSSMAASYEVFRSESGAVWERIGSAQPEAGGVLAWDDGAVVAGHSYSYRLRFADDGVMRFGGELSVTVPRGFALALQAPDVVTADAFQIEMTLPARGDARLEIFDVSGRRVFERSDSRDAGRHVVSLGSQWTPGVYWVRLERAGTSVQQRVAILR